MNIDYTGVLALWSLNSTFVKLHIMRNVKSEKTPLLYHCVISVPVFVKIALCNAWLCQKCVSYIALRALHHPVFIRRKNLEL